MNAAEFPPQSMVTTEPPNWVSVRRALVDAVRDMFAAGLSCEQAMDEAAAVAGRYTMAPDQARKGAGYSWGVFKARSRELAQAVQKAGPMVHELVEERARPIAPPFGFPWILFFEGDGPMQKDDLVASIQRCLDETPAGHDTLVLRAEESFLAKAEQALGMSLQKALDLGLVPGAVGTRVEFMQSATERG